jgi:hypothetical protein
MQGPFQMPDASVEPESRRARARPARSDWVSRTLAGLVLGFTLANIASGLLMTRLRDVPLEVAGQLAMWLVPPVWLLVLSLAYFFSTGLRAWAWLLGANAAALGTLWMLAQGGTT